VSRFSVGKKGGKGKMLAAYERGLSGGLCGEKGFLLCLVEKGDNSSCGGGGR